MAEMWDVDTHRTDPPPGANGITACNFGFAPPVTPSEFSMQVLMDIPRHIPRGSAEDCGKKAAGW